MARSRRKVENFGLSFLDCICCGFGAVLLIYVYLTAETSTQSLDRSNELTAEVNLIEEEVVTGRRNLVVLRNELEKTISETASAAARTKQLLAELESRKERVSTYDATSLAQRERIEKLKADVRSLEEGTRRLEGGSLDRAPPGQETRAFRDTGGNRRYITGLRMHGTRILILVDASASMLHQDLVSIIKLRNQPETTRRGAAKWRRAIDTVGWLATQLPPGSRYQIVSFNTSAQPLIAGSSGKWHDSADPEILSRNIAALQSITPQDGTNFAKAFIEAKKLNPAPDQIVLVTDGLPTQGTSPPRHKYIDAQARARLFDDSISLLPDKAKVDVVLLPLEGELPAAHRFWRLARFTGGTFLMPSKDWP
ncbi:MAG TPA: VWA domain-containing protein [Steroidobacteraceae bacterium]|nr:VWA domain-containing protein [Steroidobacteraceae bacterium]